MEMFTFRIKVPVFSLVDSLVDDPCFNAVVRI